MQLIYRVDTVANATIYDKGWQQLKACLIRAASSLAAFGVGIHFAIGAVGHSPVAVEPHIEENIQNARIFEEPLIATGPTTAAEDAELWQTLEQYRIGGDPEELAPLVDFLARYPQSNWQLGLRANLGLTYYRLGYFSRAIAAWEVAWRTGKKLRSQREKALADRVLGELIRMHARLGHADRLEALMKEVDGRPLVGPATEAAQGAREGLWMMRNDPGVAYLCGPMALKSILLLQGGHRERIAKVESVRAGEHGISLDQVSQLANDVELPYKAVHREAGAPIPLPAVVHWKVNHYAAIVGEESGRYHVQDPTFGQDLWVSKQALEAESSGYFLIRSDQATGKGWRDVALAEAKDVFGMGFTSGPDPNPTGPQDPKDPPSPCPCPGVPQAAVHSMLVSLNIEDTPVSYRPPKGPSIDLTLTYNQRDANQPAIFTYTNFGPKWTFNWLSYVQDNPTVPGANVLRYIAGGGGSVQSGYDSGTGAFTRDPREASVLVRVSGTPIVYERRMADGSKEVYGQSDGAAFYPRRVFLTQLVDRLGNAVTLGYDSQRRLLTITDAIGQVTQLVYGDVSNPKRVTQITDPFGRNTLLGYDGNGRLSSLTDAIGMNSTFGYDGGTFINTMTTPYGTSHFTYGENGTQRWVNLTDPLGHTERVEFLHQAPGMPFSEPVAPTGMTPILNQYIYYRNTFYWDKLAYAQAAGDYTKAHIRHWLHSSINSTMTSDVMESIKDPLERRVWYTYAGQPAALYSGTLDKPTAIGRVLDNGQTQLTRHTYNAQGNVTSTIDPVGRQTFYEYAANGIDRLRIKQKNGALTDLLAEYTYNGLHEPLIMKDAAGQTTIYEYNAAGQLTKVTNALQEVTRYEYDTSGYLLRIINPNNAVAQSFTYDSVGRIASQTDSEGRTEQHQYDELNRLVLTTYPDGTTEQRVWDKLDLASVTDRLGRTTQYGYDSARNRVSVTDPLPRTIGYSYYPNSALESLTDGNNNVTTWQRDIQSRVTSKTYPDNSKLLYGYEATTSRLKTLTDALGQVKTVSYTLDNRIGDLSYTAAANATPPVSFTYDMTYPRLASVVGTEGTHLYQYYPVGVPGANQLAVEALPGHADVLAYNYDPLGRLSARNIGNLAEAFAYDTLGRLTQHTTPLGAFVQQYLGQTGLMTHRTLANTPIASQFQYLDNVGDRRLKEILNQNGAGSDPRKFLYETDPMARILSMTEQGGQVGNLAHAYGYDGADRVVTDGGHGPKDTTYTYDPADNLLEITDHTSTQTAQVNNLNEITAVNGTVFQYDANGNVRDDGLRQYDWDAENRPIRIRYTGSPGKESRFGYDGLSRRTSVVEVDPTGQTETRFVWCGQDLCQKRDASDNLLRAYYPEGEYGPALAEGTKPGNPHAGIPPGLVYAGNHLGSVTETMRLDGRVVSHTDYSAYGETETSGEPNAVSDFRYARMLYHEPSSLYLTLYRAYDPALGRWLTRDPIGEVSFNVYAYVEGNPISFSDPFGLETYGCTKPLHALGKFGQWVYNPNNNDLFHEFLCVKVGDKYVCGGQDRSGGPYSPGKPSDDTFDKDQCKPLSPPCNVDDCVKKAINDPTRPFYGLKGVGTNCQEWAEDVYARCIRQCQGR